MSDADAIESSEIAVGGGGMRSFAATFDTERQAFRAAQAYLAKYPAREFCTSLQFVMREAQGAEKFDVVGHRTSGPGNGV